MEWRILKILALMTLDVFRLSFGEAFSDLGHDVKYLGTFNAETLNAEIRSFQPDMAVSMGWDAWQQDKYIRGELHAIREVLEKHRLFHLYFAEEDWLHFERWSSRYCRWIRPSFVLTRSPLTIREYEAMGIRATYFDVGYNPGFHKPGVSDPAFACDVAIVANGNFTKGEMRYKSISDLVLPLLTQPYDVRIWGKDWELISKCYPDARISPEFIKGKLPFPDTVKVYNSAKICISIQSCRDQLSNRTMDILGSGGFLLTSDTKAVREKLLPGINCTASASPERTLEIVSHYLAHNEEREEIARQGCLSASRQFSYSSTLLRVWPEIKAEWEWHSRTSHMAIPANLIIDGGFHNPEQTWTSFQAEPFIANGSPKLRAIKFADGVKNAYIMQQIDVTPGKTYVFSARFAKEGEGSGAPITILIQYYTEDRKLLEFGVYATIFATDMESLDENKPWFAAKVYTKEVPTETAYAILLINKLGRKESVPVLITDCRMIESRV